VIAQQRPISLLTNTGQRAVRVCSSADPDVIRRARTAEKGFRLFASVRQADCLRRVDGGLFLMPPDRRGAAEFTAAAPQG
jgi:hypothetical protein